MYLFPGHCVLKMTTKIILTFFDNNMEKYVLFFTIFDRHEEIGMIIDVLNLNSIQNFIRNDIT